ncbi:hypothetical protein [Pseudodesulfovibrio indicus]|uniref:hypothetical protein n=1 Tax=Pseudodesulfovibrio indicus TaxID=1716143 RepID=UPI00292D8F67|nr:hypothetical protein [Pseudodesulfovibrio indicus]
MLKSKTDKFRSPINIEEVSEIIDEYHAEKEKLKNSSIDEQRKIVKDAVILREYWGRLHEVIFQADKSNLKALMSFFEELEGQFR